MTPAELVLRHIALLHATIATASAGFDLASSQLSALEDYVKELQPAPAITMTLPEHCNGIPEEMCALRSDDARIDKSSLANPNRWTCRGCHVLSTDGVTT